MIFFFEAKLLEAAISHELNVLIDKVRVKTQNAFWQQNLIISLF